MQKNLSTLDVGNNKITEAAAEELAPLTELEEFWVRAVLAQFSSNLSSRPDKPHLSPSLSLPLTRAPVYSSPLARSQANDNLLHSIPVLPPSTHPNLSTIYLEGNPLQKELGTAYRRKVILECPQVSQVDATFVRQA